MKNVFRGTFVLVLAFIFNLNDANAIHKVTEILPSGKLLICKDRNQVRNGNSVVIYNKRFPLNRKNNPDLNSKEFITLPEIGQEIVLSHKEFHNDKSIFPKYHSVEIGKAVIISASLIGEDRVVPLVQKNKKNKEKTMLRTITQAESESILKDCLVAETKDNFILDELALVSW